jgi:hypothetical protein
MTLADYVIIWTENVPDRKDLARSAQGFLQVLIRFPGHLTVRFWGARLEAGWSASGSQSRGDAFTVSGSRET